MSEYISYEMVINLKQIDVINLRQSSFFQIRVTVLQNITPEVFLSSLRQIIMQFLFLCLSLNLKIEANLSEIALTPIIPLKSMPTTIVFSPESSSFEVWYA